MREATRKTWQCALLVALWWSGAGARADEPPPAVQKEGPTAFNKPEPKPKRGLKWGDGDGQSHWIPAGNILLYEGVLNLFDRHYVEPKSDYRSTFKTIGEHFRGGWTFDNDNFEINQFGHPYSGSMYHGFARAAGLGYWPSLGYTFAGSFLWEEAGETTKPSINDQFTTGIGGTFLGEPLFRMASLVLESADGPPSRWRSLAAALVSPATGATRLFYGQRFDGVFPSHSPAVYTRAQLGANINASLRSTVNLNPDPTLPPIPQGYERGEGIADFTMIYGLPGKPGYTYHRPFDYFTFELQAANDNALAHLMTRGLLFGDDYGSGEHYRGIWGLYGSYEYIAPQIFRVSTTSLGVGTTGQWWLSRNNALQCEMIAGLGYGSGGEIHGVAGQRTYHYGLTPQGQTTLRLILSDRAAIEVAARDYYISPRASAEAGSENIGRLEAGFTLRVFGLHGITVKYTASRRDARYETLPETLQTVQAVSIGYTYIGHRWFGAVDWRDPKP